MSDENGFHAGGLAYGLAAGTAGISEAVSTPGVGRSTGYVRPERGWMGPQIDIGPADADRVGVWAANGCVSMMGYVESGGSAWDDTDSEDEGSVW